VLTQNVWQLLKLLAPCFLLQRHYSPYKLRLWPTRVHWFLSQVYCTCSKWYLQWLESNVATKGPITGCPLKPNPFRKYHLNPAARALFRDFNSSGVASPFPSNSTSASPITKRIKHTGARLQAEARTRQQEQHFRSYHMGDPRGYGSIEGQWRDYLHSQMPRDCPPRRSLRIARLGQPRLM
jgi:hypothetical protein